MNQATVHATTEATAINCNLQPVPIPNTQWYYESMSNGISQNEYWKSNFHSFNIDRGPQALIPATMHWILNQYRLLPRHIRISQDIQTATSVLTGHRSSTPKKQWASTISSPLIPTSTQEYSWGWCAACVTEHCRSVTTPARRQQCSTYCTYVRRSSLPRQWIPRGIRHCHPHNGQRAPQPRRKPP